VPFGSRPGLAAVRVVVAHLGNGASLRAMRDEQSQDTTVGFTALDAAATAGISTGGAGRISTPGSRAKIHVIPTDEEATIARYTHDMVT